MKLIAKRVIGWILVLCMLTSMAGQSMTYVAQGAAADAPDQTPGLDFSMEYVSGGNSINQNKNKPQEGDDSLSGDLSNRNCALLGRGLENAITVNLKADLRATGTATGMYFELDLPVFRVEDGKLIQLTDAEIENVTENDKDIVRVMIQFAPQNPDLWDGFVSGESYWGNGVRIYRNGRIEGGKQEVVEAKLYFDGPMPENSAALVKLGGGYQTYTYNGINYPEFHVSAGSVSDPLSIFTMICCNLEWEADIQGVEPKNVMWDKWNYVTYKVTIKNTSSDKDSNFTGSNFQLVVPTNLGTVEGWSSGMHVEQAAKWLYNDGNPIKNTDFESHEQREKLMVGVPEKGGIMVYDVTDLEATNEGREAISKWDMVSFSNIKDEKGTTLEPMPYYFKPDGGVYFGKKGKVYNEEGSKVHNDGEAYDHKTYYVSFPMSTDIPSNKLASINVKAYNTIEFGNDYTWTKTTNHVNSGFIAPSENFVHDKFVVEKKEQNGKEVEEEKDKIFVAINDEADYYLGHFKNTGNIPAFYGMATDTHDKDFQLTRISAVFNVPKNGEEPELKDWFMENDTVEFEFLTYDNPDGTGEFVSEFVPLGSMVTDNDLSDEEHKVWSLQIGSLIKDYVESINKTGKKCVYNNKFRVRFKKKINPNEEFDGRIAVHGVAAKGKVYKNKLDTTYEKWIWNPTVVDEDGDEGYVKTSKSVSTDEAEIEAVVAKPQINSLVIEKTESGYKFDDPKTVPVNVEGYGFFYQLGNDSVSRIVPGEFNTGTFASVSANKSVKGFITDKLILSKRLVEDIAEIKTVTLHTSAESDADVILTLDDFNKDEDGNYYIERSKWETKGEILSVSVDIKKFEKEIKLNEANKDIYVAVEGQANIVTPVKSGEYGIIPVGKFETKYDDDTLNVKVQDKATMIVAATKPQINSLVIEKTESGYNFDDPKTVPVNVAGYGFFYQLGNDSVSRIVPGEFNTGTFASVNANKEVKGFITDKLILSKRLVENVAKINSITLHTSAESDADVTLTLDDFDKDADGNYYIERSKWETKGEILSVSVDIKKFEKEIKLNEANRDIYVAVEGKANIVTPSGSAANAIRPTGKFETKYDETELNVSASDLATMIVANINPVIRGISYGRKYLKDSDKIQSAWNKSSGAAKQSTINLIEVPKGIDDSGYKFYIGNATLSSAGKSEIAIDLSSSVGNKTAENVNVKGFLTKTITIADFKNVADIKQIRLYNWDKDPKSDDADVIIPFSDLVVEDGTVTIHLEDYSDIEYLKYMVIDMNDFYGGGEKDTPEMEIVLNGDTNWYDYLDAVLTFTPEDESMKGQGNTMGTVSLTDRLSIQRPYAELHADVHYYEINGTTETINDGYAPYNRDKNNKRLGVPYDRDFSYTIDVGNPYISKLDDFDISIDLPVNNNKQGTEANTGFHTTGFRISKKLIKQYEKLETITFFDVDEEQGKEFTVDYAAGTLTSKDGETVIEDIVKDGDIYINEEKIYTESGMNIHNLKKVIISGKGFQAYDDAPADAEHRITVYGFSDSAINTWNTMTVNGTNYLCGFRGESNKFALNTLDTAQALISKMYFDSTIVAGYKDNNDNGQRFDVVSDSFEHVRYECRSYNHHSNHWPEDCELDIGYKAIGSYMIDFRQYLNAGANRPSDASHHELSDLSGYSNCTPNNYIYTQSMNTAADVQMTVNIPSESFEAYYIKVHPMAYKYLEELKIHRQGDDEDAWETITNWKDSVEKIAGSTEKDSYYRVDLCKLGDDYGIYKTPENDYAADQPVDKIIIKLNINRDAYTETEEGGKKAKNADYGTWYEQTKYMFEVTGRFYKEGIADATASTKMKIGNLIDRPYAKAKVREDEGKPNGYNNIDTAYRSSWSYTDHYKLCSDYWHDFYHYKSSHLFSTAKVCVYPERNNVQKGVHKSTTQKTETQAKFSTYNEYAVSFWQEAAGEAEARNDSLNGCYTEHASIGHSCDHAYNNDPFNWSGKHSFTDKIVLTDTLPYVRPDEESGYFGFLTKKIFISQNLKQYIDKVVVYKKKAVLNEDGSCSEQNLTDTIEIKGADLVQEDVNAKRPEASKGSDAHVIHSTDSNTFYEIPIIYQDSEESADTSKIVLGEDEYVTKYEIYMKNLPGDVDYASELKGQEGLFDSYNHGSSTDQDIYVGGDIYRVTDDNIVSSGAKNDWNNMSVSSFMQKSNSAYYKANDNALITSYRIPFQGGYSVTRDTSADRIYDYHIDNQTPVTAKFNVKVWNRKDKNDEEERSAEIDSATVTNTMNGNYRLKTIYIPSEFVEGKWFNIEYLQLDSTKIEFKDLKTSKYFTKNEGSGQYEFDVNAYIRDNVESFGTYTANNTKKGNSEYCREYIGSFIIKFNGFDKENILDGGEFLNPARESLKDVTISDAVPTFSYDGVYADRNKTDIASNSWTFDSKPTVINSANHYTSSTQNTNNLGVKFTTSENDAWPYGYKTETGTGKDTADTKKTDYYIVDNLVSTMVVDMKRLTTFESGNSTFAYDIDGDQILNVDKSHLLPDDYVEYQVTVGAHENSMIPLYHPDLRFKAPSGQRIVGWYVLNNDSNIPKDDITAKAVVGSDTVSIDKGKRYCLDSKDAVTNYKSLEVSCGDLSKSDAYNQLNKNEKIQIVIVTEITHELDPFEGKGINTDKKERIYVCAHPKHTYSQYSILQKNGQSHNSASGDYYTDSAEDAVYYRGYGNGYYSEIYDRESTYYTDIRSSLQLFDSQDLQLTLKYADGYELPDKSKDTNLHLDERPMIIEMRGAGGGNIYNDTLHTLSSATYTVSFLSDNKKDGRLFKGFDLVEKPVFKYPEELNPTGDRVADVWYCYNDNIGTDVGIYTSGEYAEEWIESDKIIAGDKLTQQQVADGYRLLKDAVKIRWTYNNIPANAIVFASGDKPFEFKGIGRYRDIRNDAEKQTMAADEKFTIGVSANAELTHSHSENVENTVEDGSTEEKVYNGVSKLFGTGNTTNVITRERPIVTLHTQIFGSADEANEEYSAEAVQVKGYRPGDTVWYKSTVMNNKKGQTDPQGALLEPVIFDKIPEYITTTGLNKNDITVKWYDKDGKLKEDIPSYTITCSDFENVADYGGDFVTNKSDTDGCYLGSGHGFADLTFGESGNCTSTPINFRVYTIQFEKGSRLEIGERVEVYYEAQIREENLPLAYTSRIGTNSTSKTFVDYYPKMGEYYQWIRSGESNNYSYPYVGAINGTSIQFKNQSDMMDMNYLYHDVGVSGTRNKNIDRYEYLKDSEVYMPGSGTDGNNSGRTDIYGANGYLKDEDMRTANNQQRTFYVPTRTNGKNDELPESESYRSGSISGAARDWYSRLMSLRVRSNNWQGEHEDAAIWAESRLHLQTAWLAASSEIIGDSNYLKSNEYVPTNYRNGKYDSHYNSDYWYSGCSNIRDYTRELNDDTITTLEYDQYFTSRIGAYNYGDWDITEGIEFTYIMPQGIEPKLDKDEQPDFSDIKATIMKGGTSANSEYEDIMADDITIEVVQKPGSANGYLTPNIMRDPLLSTSVMNKTGDSYEGKDPYYKAEEHTSWVFKITIKKTLSKWFNRADKSGYAMFVDIPSHVYATPKDEYWYDEVMVKPVDTEKNLYYQVYDTTTLWGNNYLLGMPSPASTQKNGMDYIWNVYYTHGDHCIDSTRYFWNGSPNTPYINGMNITNREVASQGVVEDSVHADDRQAFSKGIRNTYANTGTRAHMRKPLIRTWTTVGDNNIDGTKAEDYYVEPQADNTTLNIHVENKYWLNTLAPVYMQSYTSFATYRVRHTYATDGGNMGTLFYPVVSNILPAGIVPKDINGELYTKDNAENAKRELDWTLRGADYSGDNLNELKVYKDEQRLYESTVEYIELKGEDGKLEGRYKITFKQKAEPDIRSKNKLKIDSESARVFSLKFVTTKSPDVFTKDGTTDKRLADQYQSNHTFVSSKLDYFKFLTDSDATNAATENPYYVGSKVVDTFAHTYNPNASYNWSGTLKDVRRDSAATDKADYYLPPNTPKGKLPKVPTANNLGTDSAVNATDEGGVQRYVEDEGQIKLNGSILNMEDYPELRGNLYLQDKDSNFNDGTSNAGVHTSNRIRVKYPVIENKTFVSKDKAEAVDILGKRSPNWQSGEYDYYPSKSEPVEYLDDLYYNVKVINGADSVQSDEYYHHGSVAHSKMRVTVVLPSIVRSTSLKGDDVYLLFKEADGDVIRMNIDDAKDMGFEFEIVDHFINDELQEVIVFEVCTPGDYADSDKSPTFDEFIKGKHLPGYFGYKDSLVVGVKTKVRNNILDASGIDPTEEYWNDPIWDESFKADGYVTLDDVDGYYLKDMNPDGGFDILHDTDGAGITYERRVMDNEETSTDWDSDNDYSDEYSKDMSAVVTLLKPHSTVRLDTSIQRTEIDNPDLIEGMKRVLDDPTIRGTTKMSVYLDQAVNEGGAVGQFIVDWRIPFRSTLLGTTEEAPVTGDSITKRIYALGTGVWEIPDSIDADHREELKENLNVQVFALCSESEEDTAKDAAYKNLDNLWEGDWINLTELYNKHINGINRAGVDIDKNTIIDISELSDKIYGDRGILGSTIYQIRYVVSADKGDYAVPRGFRLAIDADSDVDGNQEMNDIDPEHENVNPLPKSVVSQSDENGKYSDESKIGNAAFIMLTGSHFSATRRHVNHFATGWARYSDTQYCVDSLRSRAGYYIARELPVIEVDMNNKYFKIGKDETGSSVYKWSDDIVINDASHMLKYSMVMKNLTDAEIGQTNVGEAEEDTATNPQLVAVVPIIQNIDMSVESKDPLIYKNYHEVEYGTEAWKSTLSPDCVSKVEFEDNQAVWTWHVEDNKGNVIDKNNHNITSVTLEMYDKIAGIEYLKQRRIMRWTSKGNLLPGERIVIDFMVPISTDDTIVLATELLSCKSYGFKPGAFIPYIPASEETTNYAYEIDARDVNDNNESNIENTLAVSVNNIGFSGLSAFNRTKRSFSEYGTGMNESGNGKDRPSLVPEGTNYEFVSSIINPDTQNSNAGFQQPIIYDVLPFVGDTQLVAQQNGFAAQRGTDWRGWLNLESLQVRSQTGSDVQQMTNGTNVHIWVGPFNYNGSKIEKIPIENLPNVEQTSSIEFYNTIRGETSSAINEKRKYFVRLSDLLQLKKTNPVEFAELEKYAQAIYVEPLSNYYLKPNTKLSVSYTLKAPLNMPLNKNYVPEDSENILNATADVDGWNSFAAQSGKDKVVESPFAGVYTAAPADRGYIGHYVWLDESYNAKFTDEGDYIQRDGRWILNKATKDLDYDGKIDDPGINDVKVELLSEKGYPVNRLGEAVVEKDGRFCVIDEDTGKISVDSRGTPIYTTYGPMSYTTEKDAYGNDGYFIISNIKPGKYNLRYTFPKDSKYNKYALTTRDIGVTDTPVHVYRPGEEDTLPDLGETGKGDEPSDGAKVESFTIQTTEAIQIDAIDEDPSTYADYDEKMTSYDLGVAPSFAYGGYAWKDIKDINGLMDDEEQKIKNVAINIFEVKADGSQVPAYDKNGYKIDTLYTDENGYFSTTLYPYRSYIAIADTKKVTDAVQPSPITLSTRALQYDKDNDLSYNEDLNKNTTNVFSIIPTSTDYGMGTCVDGQYGSYDRLGFGYVPVGVGAIGKYVFNDENYDGIRNEYIDKDGYIISEPGIDGVKLVLEQYYHDGEKWQLLDDHYAETTSLGSSYAFIIEEPTYTDGTDKFICGYKVKVDMSTVPENFVPTKFYMNNGVSDSDLPVSGDNYRYLTKDIVVISSEADANSLDEYKVEAGDKTYDISKSLIITKYDAGFTTVDRSRIDGVVWNDKNYNGRRDKFTDEDDNQVDEPGVTDIELQLVPYVYYNDSWKLLEKDDLMESDIYNEYTLTTISNNDGEYSFTGVRPIAVMADGTKCIVGYKVRVDTDIESLNFGITKYKIGDSKEDSDLWKRKDNEFILNEEDEFIITAKKIAKDDLEKEYGKESLKNQDEFLIHNKLGYYEVNKITDYSGNDAGLVEFRKNSISGKVWLDADYNGIMDDSEHGMVREEVTIKRYYLEDVVDGESKWVEDTTYSSPVVKTDDLGDYLFDNLDTYIYKDGKYYLAGYKVAMFKAPDTSLYGITLYGKYDKDTQRGSDLKGLNITKDSDYIIIADKCETVKRSSAAVKMNALAHVVAYKGNYYDLVTAKAYEKLDAGYHPYPNATITGCVFDDLNYDGFMNKDASGKDDTFSDALKAALGSNEIIVKATAYYYDGSKWNLYKDDTDNAVTYTDSVDSTSTDGKYEISVPTKITIDGKNYLAGYTLEVNMVPTGYHITKHMADGAVSEANALIRTDSPRYSVTKTISSRPYAGTIKEEMNGYIVGAKPSVESSSSNIVGDYDIAEGRIVKEYNIGYTAHETSKIDGIAFKDENDNGKYDKAADKLLSGVKVGVKRYSFDEKNNVWNEAPEASNPEAKYFATTSSDSDGYYAFENLPTHEDRDETGEGPVLYGYTVWLIEMPVSEAGEEMAATYYQANNHENDSALIADSMQIMKAQSNPNLDADELKDGNTVIAHKLTKDDSTRSHIVEGYDCTVGSPRDGYNLGFVDYDKGSIKGCVFDDKNIDGIIDKDDAKFENIGIGLKRFVYEDGHWKPAQGDDEYFATTVTDNKGNYIFDDLNIFTSEDGEKHIYGYEVWSLNTPNDYVMTRYQSNNGKNDSAVLLNSQIIKKDNTLSEVLDGKLVVARKTDTPEDEGLDLIYMVEGYDVARATHLEDYNAGYTVLRKGEINGVVFEDSNYDGILDKNESAWSGVEVGIKRFVYTDGKWVPAPKGDEEYFATAVTDNDGRYKFDNLKTHVKENGENKLYGYEVWVIKDANGYAVTRYGDDSFLLVSGKIIKADTELPEMLDNKLVVAHKITDRDDLEGINDVYFVEGYNVILAEILSDYNAGYFKEQEGSISGTVFDDINYDGKIDDQDVMMKDIEVGLKRFVYTDGAWEPVENEDGEYFATTVTDEKGRYTFDNLKTHVKENGENKLYGYEVWIIKDADGYAVTRYGDDSFLLVSGQIIKADTELPEMLDNKLVVAHKVTADENTKGIDEIYFVEGYNVVLAEALDDYNAGYFKEQEGSISGAVFDDINYDGKIDDQDVMMKDIEVGLKRFVYTDGKWVPAPKGDEEYFATAVTDADGHYKFDNLKTHVKEAGENKLYGYEVWIIKDADGYAATRYGDDSFLLVSGQVIKADTELPEMLDNKLVVAHKVTADENTKGIDEIYFVEGYNVVLAEALDDYNAGYFKEQEGSISGTVFDDINYDGKIDNQDVMMKDIEVELKRFVYTDGKWVPAPKGDEEYFATAVTDADGHYKFDNLKTHVKEDGENKLYGYEVWIISDVNGYAATRYGDDSFLFVNGQIIKMQTDELPEMLDNKLVVAHKVTDDENTKGIDEIYFVEGYNVVLAEALDNYNAGYTKVQKGSITGRVFDDVNYDGLIDNEDDMLKDIEIGLKRFVYKGGEWELAQDEENGEQFFAKTVTDKDGNYAFENLDAYISDDGNNYLYGYELYIINHNDRLATKYQMNDGVDDSALLTDTYQIIKKNEELEELYKGCIVLVQLADKDENPNEPYIVEGYDVVKGTERDQNNAGFVAEQNYSISGLVWIDNDRDGICNDEDFVKGIDVTLERLYLSNGQWKEMSSDTFVTVQTDKDGNYKFENLELYGVVDDQPVIYGYRVKVPYLPGKYGVTIFHADGEGNKSDLNEKTAYLESDKALIVLADTADENTPNKYSVEGYNISHGEYVESLDAGVIPYGVGSIAGIVFEDTDEDGILDNKEEVFEGKTVYLEYQKGYGEEAEFVRYPGKKAVTDENGAFVFDNLPVLDENNQPYKYRLTMEKPDERSFTKSYEFVILGDKKSNILSADTEKGEEDKITTGITPVITLAVPREDKNNYYKLKYEFDGYNHQNAYLGFTPVEEARRIQTGFDSTYLLVLLSIIFAAMAGAVVVTVGNKKRRKETE